MIKQIQLRGISRTPSDRMSEDGGLSESLNMYLDTAENAPALVPEDVTTELGLPADLHAERIFIHKTANYENYIAVQDGKVVAYTPDIEEGEPLSVLDLEEGEEVSDITSVGNTLIISTTSNLYYVLYKNRTYTLLGNKVPFPMVTFHTVDEGTIQGGFSYKEPFPDYYDHGYSHYIYSDTSGDIDLDADARWEEEYRSIDRGYPSYIPIASEWEDDKVTTSSIANKNILYLLDKVSTLMKSYTIDKDYPKAISGPVFIRYAVELYDGSVLSSIPIFINPFDWDKTFYFEIMRHYVRRLESDYIGKEEGQLSWKAQFDVNQYSIKAIMERLDLSLWSDIILKINIYSSIPTQLGISEKKSTLVGNNTEILEEEIDSYHVERLLRESATVAFEVDKGMEEDILTLSSSVYKIGEFVVKPTVGEENGINKLMEGVILEFPSSSEVFASQQMLAYDDMKHNIIMSEKVSTYNNRLLLLSTRQILAYDYIDLNSIIRKPVEDSSISFTKDVYDVAFLINTGRKDLVVKKRFEYRDNDGEREDIYSFQIYPDSRCAKMLVKLTSTFSTGASGVTTISYGEFDMKPHPYLDCSYFYAGSDVLLASLLTSVPIETHEENSVDDISNVLMLSQSDNPFYFPLNNRYTFQSKVVGVAIATTALSQGQFGQFPLYVFTEDGIWAMETAADGSFITQKPLSREVCVNPDSICSIDNAVVFVTDKAVMMIQGSQVMNISPYMNGKHYEPNASATELIAKQDGYAELVEPISDSDPFMKFMRDAKVAYDYTGQRLVFISESNQGFQYVYKLDTQTWHKVSFGLSLDSALNSYPEALVTGEGEYTYTQQYLTHDRPFDMDMQEVEDVYDNLIPSNYNCITTPSLFVAENLIAFANGSIDKVDITGDDIDRFVDDLSSFAQGFTLLSHINILSEERLGVRTSIYDLSTILDASRNQDTAKGILITRPFDLGMPDVYKSITSIKIRGDYDKGNVKYILQGSDDGRNFYTLNSLRGKSWKMFRIFILADLEPTERISWIDVDFEPRYNNRLR